MLFCQHSGDSEKILEDIANLIPSLIPIIIIGALIYVFVRRQRKFNSMSLKGEISEEKFPKWHYLAAWFLCIIIVFLIQVVLYIFVAMNDWSGKLDPGYLLLITIPIPFFVGFHITYIRVFNKVNLKKVMPYFYWLGTIGLMANLGGELDAIDQAGYDIGFFAVCGLSAWCLSLIVTRFTITNRYPQRWAH
jgi:hypothetical protein